MDKQTNFILIITHSIILIFSLFMIAYICIIEFFGSKSYSTPPFIPLVSFLIALIYFCLLLFKKINASKAHKNTKGNYRGFIYSTVVVSTLACLIFCIVLDTIPTALSDILTILAILLTVSCDILTDILKNFAESKLY